MKESTKKLLTKIFKKIFIFLLTGFTAIYISEATGYYEFEQHNKKVMTEEKIREFENDVKQGKNIDLNNYMVDDTKNYESKLSKFGDDMSDRIEDVVVGCLNATFNYLNGIMG